MYNNWRPGNIWSVLAIFVFDFVYVLRVTYKVPSQNNLRSRYLLCARYQLYPLIINSGLLCMSSRTAFIKLELKVTYDLHYASETAMELCNEQWCASNHGVPHYYNQNSFIAGQSFLFCSYETKCTTRTLYVKITNISKCHGTISCNIKGIIIIIITKKSVNSKLTKLFGS